MNKLKPYLKSVVAGLGTILYTLTAVLSDDKITNQEWVSIATAVAVTLGVYTVPNKPAADTTPGGAF